MANPPQSIPAEVRSAIEALLTEFCWRLDHAGAGSVADLFLEEGQLSTPQVAVCGRRHIADWFDARTSGAKRITRHSWSNLRLSGQSADRIVAEAQVMTVTSPIGAGADTLDVIIGDTTDVVAQDPLGGWRFHSRRLDVVMRGRVPNSSGDSHEARDVPGR